MSETHSRFRDPKTNKLRSRFSPVLMAATGFAMPLAMSFWSPQRAEAINYFYDNDSATPGFGTAGGSWLAPTPGPTPGWTTDSTGSVIPGSVTTLTTDTVNFGNGATGLGAGTITVGAVASGNMTFASGSGAIVLSGGTINLAPAATTTITVDNAANTINSNLSGAGAILAKAGAGTLTLSTVNTFTGAVNVTGGVLAFTGQGNADPTIGFGAGIKNVTLSNNAAIRPTTNSDPSNNTKTFVIGSGGGTIDVPTGVQFLLNDGAGATGQLQGAGTLTVTGAGTGNVSLGNSYTSFSGNVNVNSATLVLTNANAIGNTGGQVVNVASGASLNIQATLANGKTYNVIGTGVSGAGALMSTGTGNTGTGSVNLTGNASLGGTGTLTIGGVIGDGGSGFSLTKVGTGTLILDNANTYSGTTTVSAGTLQLGNGGTTGSLNTASALSFVAGTNFQINQTDTVTQGVDFSGAAFTGNVNLIKAGTGNLVLTGNNTVRELRVNNATGFIDIGSGNLFVNNGGGNTISSTTGGTINGTGTITLGTGGGVNFGDNSSNSGTLLTINPRVTGANGFEYCCAAGGTIFLANNTNDFAGQVFINSGGTLRVSTINNGGVASGLGLGSQINLNANGANLEYVGTTSSTNRNIILGNNTSTSITQSGASGHLLFNGTFSSGAGAETLTLQGSTAGTGEISSVIADGGGTQAIGKSGTGTWTLSGTNTYTGATTVTEGVLKLLNNAALGTTAGGATVLRGGNLQLDGTRAIGTETLTFGGPETTGGANAILSTSGAGNKSWAGNFVGNENFTVDSSVAGTLLTLSGNVDLKASAMTVSGPGNTLISGVISNAFNASGVASGLREMTINGNSFDEISANISGNLTAGVTQGNTTSGWADNRTFVYTGQFFDADGIFAFAENIDDNTRIVIDGTLRLRNTVSNVITGTHQTAGGVTGTLAAVANANPNGGTTNFGMGPNGDGWHNIEIRVGNGIGGAGPTTGSNWSATKGFAFFNGVPANLDGATYTVLTDPGNASVFRNLQTAVPLIKNGAGTLTLTNANTYSGGTNVNQGVLLVNNASGSGLGTGDVVVASGATIGGSGGFTGDLLLNTGAIIAPDGSLDTGSLTFGNNAIYNWEVGDLINVMGDLTFVGDAIINIIDNGAPALGTHALFTWDGNLTGFNPANFTFNLVGFDPGFASRVFADFGSNTIFLVNFIPEPTSLTLLGLAGLTLMRRRRA